jgi:hypothetical protein
MNRKGARIALTMLMAVSSLRFFRSIIATSSNEQRNHEPRTLVWRPGSQARPSLGGDRGGNAPPSCQEMVSPGLEAWRLGFLPQWQRCPSAS